MAVLTVAVGCHADPGVVQLPPSPTSSGGSTGSSGGASNSGSSTGTSSWGTTGGSSTGSIFSTPPPSFLMDAGPGTVLGPISIANGSNGREQIGARLIYSLGDGGQFGIYLTALFGDGAVSAPPELVGTTAAGRSSPPNASLAAFQTGTGFCWEDLGSPSNSSAVGCFPPPGPIISCGTVDVIGDSPVSTYSNCGSQPILTFNPVEDVTQLFFSGGAWPYVGTDGQAMGGPNFWGTGGYRGVPFSGGIDFFIVLPGGSTAPADLAQALGLVLVPITYGAFGYGAPPSPGYDALDPSFSLPGQFVATSNLPSQTIAALELDALGLRATTWSADAGASAPVPIASINPVLGPIAAGTCSQGFAYLAATDAGTILFAERDFAGNLLGDSATELALPDFTSQVTSLAVATQPGNGLVLAVGSASQVATFLVGCE